ncbi:hypothetical protein [Candidatus Babela massiliensis]|uniref:DNA polymerase III delta subunit n=1 Tax=Candidatus Babela massiliensis TaxID=673862 RepID=V6DJ47_9BACT|nr:hypothetical protein [Candidatus Babela massiliensis]CDK30536.1 hypothetical protein BABL1_gene_483 [Candidatus Babela massiliensis]
MSSKFLSQFTKAFNDLPNLSKNIILLKFESYSSIFVSKLFSKLKFHLPNQVILLSLANLDLSQLSLKLQTSFLGQEFIYFIKDFYDLEVNLKNELYNYFLNYDGPNKIFIFDTIESNIVSDKFLIFEVPSSIDVEVYSEFYDFFYSNYSRNKLAVKRLFDSSKTLSLDLSLTIMNYQVILPNKSEIFFDNWLTKLRPTEKSLFMFSQYFFDKQNKNFFELWLKYKLEYPYEFWIAFWSDQIWQAALFVLRANKLGIFNAKKYASKLPFSFMNKSWSAYDYEFLCKAYQNLYKIDFDIKNGLGHNALELWFYKFLFNKF